VFPVRYELNLYLNHWVMHPVAHVSTNIYYVEESRPPLWSSGQSSWLLNGDVLCFL
jgi:hypothetical protein